MRIYISGPMTGLSDLAAVRSCDAICLLRGWETSRGAKKELAEALAHGLQVMQEGGEE